MLISQVQTEAGLSVVTRDGTEAYAVRDAGSVRELALEAAARGQGLAETIHRHGLGPAVDLQRALAEGRMLCPIHHPDPAHLHLTGAGLTHLGSARTRDRLPRPGSGDATDCMKIFDLGLTQGRPEAGRIGAQPQWFYKGDGTMAVPPGGTLTSPGYAQDGGEEPEIAGIYVIGADGTPFRVGYALAHAFSDHVVERQKCLYLAHAKLRPASFGPEILLGELPQDLQGTSRILRGGEVIRQRGFATGEANMTHSLGNLEHHHFKYDLFRQPGDVHVHMFGTATLSFADGIAAADGDQFEIDAPTFGLALRNRLRVAQCATVPTMVQAL